MGMLTGKMIEAFRFFKNNNRIRTFWNQYWLLLTSLIVFIIPFFYKSGQLFFLGSATIIFGVDLIRDRKKYSTLMGIILVLFGIVLITFNFTGYGGSIAFFLFLIIVSILVNRSIDRNKKAGLFIGILFSFFFYELSISIFFPLISEFVSKLYLDPLPNWDFFSLSILAILVCVSFYFFFRNLLYLFSKMNGFAKLNTRYLALSLAIISIVVLCGFWGWRIFYTGNYPLEVPNIGVIKATENFTCNGLHQYPYFVEGDVVTCSGLLEPPKNRKIENVTVYYRIDSNETNETQALDNGTLKKIEFHIYQNVGTYILSVESKDFKTNDSQTDYEHLNLEVISKEEYKAKKRDSISFLGGGFLLVIFAVFSAISNLKNILESKK